MAHRDGERLTAAWTPPAMAAAITSVAKVEGVSKSQLVREALAARLLSLPDARARDADD